MAYYVLGTVWFKTYIKLYFQPTKGRLSSGGDTPIKNMEECENTWEVAQSVKCLPHKHKELGIMSKAGHGGSFVIPVLERWTQDNL